MSGACCRSSSSTATTATTCAACRTARAEELEDWVEANAAALRTLLPADLVFTNHVVLGGPVGAAAGAPFAVKAHRSELEYSMRGNPAPLGVGRRIAARRTGHLCRLRAHPRRPGGGLRRRPRMSSRYLPESTSTNGCRSRARQRSPTYWRRRGGIRRIPRTPRSDSRTRATPPGSRPSFALGEPSSSTSAS